jgi:predicted RND superfamily exporter protein
MRLKTALIRFSTNRYRFVTIAIVLFTLATGAFMPLVTIDTDPENMLEKDEPVRVFHNESKKQFNLSETIMMGVINERNPDGVFNPTTLKRVYELTEYAKTLRWKDEKRPGQWSGVMEVDMIAPSLVDHMSQQTPGSIRFEWLMPRPPETREEALAIRDKVLSNPLLKGQMVSEDGKALCIYLPLTDKLLSYRVYTEMKKKIEEIGGDEEYHIAGLPVAESAIGVEMFNQMAFAAPLTMIVILGLLFLFFRKWVLIILPMVVATVTVVSTMGLLIAFGFPVHILSSMMPIFLMPIAICNSVHILSDFFESYTKEKGRKQTIKEVMERLFKPVLYTSLTTAVGFLSFVTTSIPPAKIFGVFVAVGVMIAWVVTVLLVPAYVMMVPERMLDNFGESYGRKEKGRQSWLSRSLRLMGGFAYRRAKFVLWAMTILIFVAVWGITQINVNDNYAKRFSSGHLIRQADTALNKHFGGTYAAYLVFEGKSPGKPGQQDVLRIDKDLAVFARQIEGRRETVGRLVADVRSKFPGFAQKADTYDSFFDQAIRYIDEKSAGATDEDFYILQELKGYFGVKKEGLKTFKQPEVLKYMAGLQAHLEKVGLIGKSTSVADVVRKVNQELTDGKKENFRIPDKLQGISECYMQFQQSHRPNDLWHYITPDFTRANIWMQFASGDSAQTEKAVKEVDAYVNQHTPPIELSYRWAGLHYVNLVFQDKMFREMLRSFCGSFIIVLIMMVVLFRSWRWAIPCMIPLTLTIAAVYGATGIIGKDYDMPVAVLSAISLGIAVDFAIHFLERSRQIYQETGSWKETVPRVFGEPALAISRNVLVVAFGFLPLMVARLIPYKTVAILLFGILFFSGFLTLLCLPALLTVAEKWFFPSVEQNEVQKKEA